MMRILSPSLKMTKEPQHHDAHIPADRLEDIMQLHAQLAIVGEQLKHAACEDGRGVSKQWEHDTRHLLDRVCSPTHAHPIVKRFVKHDIETAPRNLKTDMRYGWEDAVSVEDEQSKFEKWRDGMRKRIELVMSFTESLVALAEPDVRDIEKEKLIAPVCLADVIRFTEEQIPAWLYEKGTSMKIEMRFDLELTVLAIPGDMKIFDLNLTKNDVRHAGATERTVDAYEDEEHPEDIIIVHTDNGSGLGEKFKNNPNDIFNRNVSSREGGGLGLHDMEFRGYRDARVVVDLAERTRLLRGNEDLGGLMITFKMKRAPLATSSHIVISEAENDIPDWAQPRENIINEGCGIATLYVDQPKTKAEKERLLSEGWEIMKGANGEVFEGDATVTLNGKPRHDKWIMLIRPAARAAINEIAAV